MNVQKLLYSLRPWHFLRNVIVRGETFSCQTEPNYVQVCCKWMGWSISRLCICGQLIRNSGGHVVNSFVHRVMKHHTTISELEEFLGWTVIQNNVKCMQNVSENLSREKTS
jgi:hypothetical protein